MPAMALRVSRRSRLLSIGEDGIVCLGVPCGVDVDLEGVVCTGSAEAETLEAEFELALVSDSLEALFLASLAFSSISSGVTSYMTEGSS